MRRRVRPTDGKINYLRMMGENFSIEFRSLASVAVNINCGCAVATVRKLARKRDIKLEGWEIYELFLDNCGRREVFMEKDIFCLFLKKIINI